MSWSNQSKSSSTLSNVEISGFGLWGDTNVTWGDSNDYWGTNHSWSNQSKDASSFVNQTKN